MLEHYCKADGYGVSNAQHVINDFTETPYFSSSSFVLEKSYVSLIKQIRDSVPIPVGFTSIRGQYFSRLPRQRRSFFIDTQPEKNDPFKPVVVLKGFEPLSKSLDSMLQCLNNEGPAATRLKLPDHFAFVENKAPFALTYREVKKEIAVAEAIHSFAQSKGYKCQFPIPALLFRLDVDSHRGYLATLKESVSKSVYERVKVLTKEGLYGYVYVCQGIPYRVNNIPPPSKWTRIDDAEIHKINPISPAQVVSSWIDNVTIVLAAGHIPLSIDQINQGAFLDQNNSLINGGNVDLDTCWPITKHTSNYNINECICESICRLTETILQFFSSSHPDRKRARASTEVMKKFVFDEISNRICDMKSKGIHFDSRIDTYFSARYGIDYPLEVLESSLGRFSLD